jgi:hypothetical protein
MQVDIAAARRPSWSIRQTCELDRALQYVAQRSGLRKRGSSAAESFQFGAGHRGALPQQPQQAPLTQQQMKSESEKAAKPFAKRPLTH